MIYDKIELMKLNISEESIQKQRDVLKDALSKDFPENIKFVYVIYDKFWLPFIIDMLDNYVFTCRPVDNFGKWVRIEITV